MTQRESGLRSAADALRERLFVAGHSIIENRPTMPTAERKRIERELCAVESACARLEDAARIEAGDEEMAQEARGLQITTTATRDQLWKEYGVEVAYLKNGIRVKGEGSPYTIHDAEIERG